MLFKRTIIDEGKEIVQMFEDITDKVEHLPLFKLIDHCQEYDIYLVIDNGMVLLPLYEMEEKK